MSTGKSYEEMSKPSIQCNAGKWTGTRVFRVETSSPSIALLTIQEDANIPLGTEWDEGCDADFDAGTTTSIKMKSKTYDTAAMNSSNVMVTVGYEDSRYNIGFDETTLGLVRKYYKYGSQSEEVYQSIFPVKAWDSTHITTANYFTPSVLISGSSAVVPDRAIGFDGETLNGTVIETPQLTYGEVWRLNDDSTGSFGSSVYVPGINSVVDIDDYLWPGDRLTFLRRLGMSYVDPGTAINVTLAQIMFALTGSINSLEWRGYPAKTLLMLPPQVQQVGSEAYICNFEFAYSPPYAYDATTEEENPEIYIGSTAVTSFEKPGWDYLWYKYAAGTDKQQIEEIRVGQVYPAIDFYLLGLGS